MQDQHPSYVFRQARKEQLPCHTFGSGKFCNIIFPKIRSKPSFIPIWFGLFVKLFSAFFCFLLKNKNQNTLRLGGLA